MYNYHKFSDQQYSCRVQTQNVAKNGLAQSLFSNVSDYVAQDRLKWRVQPQGRRGGWGQVHFFTTTRALELRLKSRARTTLVRPLLLQFTLFTVMDQWLLVLDYNFWLSNISLMLRPNICFMISSYEKKRMESLLLLYIF